MFALLIGSGLSRSAGIPTGWEVTLEFVKRIAALEGAEPGEDLAGWYAGRFGNEPNYSELLHALGKTRAERRRLLHEFFEPNDDEREQGLKIPTAAHRAIARLVAKGYIKVILTTNFDRLIENALREAGVEPTVISTADAADGAAPLVHQRCVVVKLHGDYLDDRIKNTEDELACYAPRMDAYLDQVLDQFGLVVCGWSGEWDPALRAAIERCKSRRYTTYWASQHALRPRAADLATLRDAEILTIKDADSLFTALEEKVASLEELRSPAPLSIGAAVASLKRYVAEPRHHIRLHDLVMDEADRASRHLKTVLLPDGQHPGRTYQEEFVRRIRECDASTEILRYLFFHGCQWADGDQGDLFVKALRMLVPPEMTGGNTDWINMRRYPAALMLYAGAMGALVSDNYRLLRKLLDTSFRHQGEECVATKDLAAERVVRKDLALSLDPTSRTPMSDHFAALLVPMAERSVPEPERLFGTLEIMIALVFLDRFGTLNGRPWMPPGRYCWRATGEDTPPASLLREAEARGADWEPLRAGMFGGTAERFQAARDAFDQTLPNLSRYYW